MPLAELRGKLLDGRIDSPAEIAYLENIEAVEDVFRLDVAVDDAVAVEVADAAGDLAEIVAGLVLMEKLFGSNLLEEAAAGRQLQDEVDLFSVCKEPVHLQHVRVVGVQLDLDLLDELPLHFRFL